MSVILEKKIIENGYACYVSGSGELVYSPKEQDISEYVAIENHSPFWCRPFWGSSLSELPQKTQALLIKRGEAYSYYLPVCDSVFKTLIRGCENGFEFYTFSNCETVTECDRQLAYVFMEGADPHVLVKNAARAVCRLLDNGLELREEKSVPEVFNYLGWCSWDALQIRVSHDGLMKKVREFKEKNVPVHFAIIDDMWVW